MYVRRKQVNQGIPLISHSPLFSYPSLTPSVSPPSPSPSASGWAGVHVGHFPFKFKDGASPAAGRERRWRQSKGGRECRKAGRPCSPFPPLALPWAAAKLTNAPLCCPLGHGNWECNCSQMSCCGASLVPSECHSVQSYVCFGDLDTWWWRFVRRDAVCLARSSAFSAVSERLDGIMSRSEMNTQVPTCKCHGCKFIPLVSSKLTWDGTDWAFT